MVLFFLRQKEISDIHHHSLQIWMTVSSVTEDLRPVQATYQREWVFVPQILSDQL